MRNILTPRFHGSEQSLTLHNDNDAYPLMKGCTKVPCSKLFKTTHTDLYGERKFMDSTAHETIDSVCVYCSSSTQITESYKKTAIELGTGLAEHRYSLVYGGGNLGLMGDVAVSAKNSGGRVTGIIIKKFYDRGLSFTDADRMIVVDTMGSRKRIMREISDGFVALPGGFGTLDELLEVISLKQLHFHNKPVVILNTDGFYRGLIDWIDEAVAEGFIKKKYKNLYYIADSVSDCIEYIAHYLPGEVPEKWV
jgi:uncharacterized protein (TIGR00730 family)